jgi:hypothetical protein
VSPAARAFAAVALIGGLAIAIAMPPGAAPDETRHLSRVILMSEGHFGVPGMKPPRIEVQAERWRWRPASGCTRACPGMCRAGPGVT